MQRSGRHPPNPPSLVLRARLPSCTAGPATYGVQPAAQPKAQLTQELQLPLKHPHRLGFRMVCCNAAGTSRAWRAIVDQPVVELRLVPVAIHVQDPGVGTPKGLLLSVEHNAREQVCWRSSPKAGICLSTGGAGGRGVGVFWRTRPPRLNHPPAQNQKKIPQGKMKLCIESQQ